MDCMIDIETLGTSPDAVILTIGAQTFDPLSQGILPQFFYARIDTQDQTNRSIQQDTVEWWAKQSFQSQNEAFGDHDRILLKSALTDLTRLIWRSNLIWANGPTFDMTILEHAYKSFGLALPWNYGKVRDARTIFSLYPDLPKPLATHNSLEDCKRQIHMVQETLKYLKISALI